MNKYKLFGSITIAGIVLTNFGAWMKILHLLNANTFLTLGMFLESIGLSALAWFLFEWLSRKNK